MTKKALASVATCLASNGREPKAGLPKLIGGGGLARFTWEQEVLKICWPQIVQSFKDQCQHLIRNLQWHLSLSFFLEVVVVISTKAYANFHQSLTDGSLL